MQPYLEAQAATGVTATGAAQEYQRPWSGYQRDTRATAPQYTLAKADQQAQKDASASRYRSMIVLPRGGGQEDRSQHAAPAASHFPPGPTPGHSRAARARGARSAASCGLRRAGSR
jgi:hypothetical protein